VSVVESFLLRFEFVQLSNSPGFVESDNVPAIFDWRLLHCEIDPAQVRGKRYQLRLRKPQMRLRQIGTGASFFGLECHQSCSV